MYAVVELKIDSTSSLSYEADMQARIIKQFRSREAAKNLAHKLNERHCGVDPRKEIVSFIVKPV